MAWTKTEYEVTIVGTGQSHNVLRAIDDGSQTDLGSLSAIALPLGQKNVQLVCTIGGGTTATVAVEVRNGAGTWLQLASKVFISGDADTDFEFVRAWDQVRFNCTVFTGVTNVKAYVTVG